MGFGFICFLILIGSHATWSEVPVEITTNLGLQHFETETVSATPVVETTTNGGSVNAETTTGIPPRCGATNRTARVGVKQNLTSPGWPGRYGNRENCLWLFEAPGGHVILFVVNSFTTELTWDRIILTGGKGSISVISGTRKTGFIFESKNRTIQLRFRTDGSITRSGFSISYEAISELNDTRPPSPTRCGQQRRDVNIGITYDLTSPGWPDNYNSNESCVWFLEAPSGYKIKFVMQYFNMAIPDYFVVYDNETLIRNFSGYLPPGSSLISRTNLVRGRFVSDKTLLAFGFNITYTAIADIPITHQPTSSRCGPRRRTVNSGVTNVLTSPGWPGNYGNRESCEWLFEAPLAYTILFKFSSFHIEKAYDVLQFYNDKNNSLANFDGYIDRGYSYDTWLNIVRVKFTSDVYFTMRGFSINYTAIPRTTLAPAVRCGTLRRKAKVGVTKVLSSPGYPSDYGYGDNCEWVIEAPPGYKVLLKFNWFETELVHDTLKVYDGQNNTIGTFDGMVERGFKLISPANVIRMIFTTDYSVTRNGFSIDYSAYRKVHLLYPTVSSPRCDVTDRGRKARYRQTLASPGFPTELTYGNNENCLWSFKAPEGHVIRFVVVYFYIEPGHDFVTVKDELGRIGRFSGRLKKGYTFTSRGRRVQVRFRSDKRLPYPGFVLKYQTRPAARGK